MMKAEQHENHFCVSCLKVTVWVQRRTKSYCMSCTTMFPCDHCSHWDCREVRGEVAACRGCGVLREVGKTCCPTPAALKR